MQQTKEDSKFKITKEFRIVYFGKDVSKPKIIKKIRLVCFGISIILLAIGLYFLITQPSKIRNYRPVTATIIEMTKHVSHTSKKTKTWYTPTVTYQVEGVQYTKNLNFSSWDMEEGGILELHYNIDDPTDILSVSFDRRLYVILSCLGLFYLILSLFLPFVLPRSWRTDNELKKTTGKTGNQ